MNDILYSEIWNDGISKCWNSICGERQISILARLKNKQCWKCNEKPISVTRINYSVYTITTVYSLLLVTISKFLACKAPSERVFLEEQSRGSVCEYGCGCVAFMQRIIGLLYSYEVCSKFLNFLIFSAFRRFFPYFLKLLVNDRFSTKSVTSKLKNSKIRIALKIVVKTH